MFNQTVKNLKSVFNSPDIVGCLMICRPDRSTVCAFVNANYNKMLARHTRVLSPVQEYNLKAVLVKPPINETKFERDTVESSKVRKIMLEVLLSTKFTL